VSGLATVDARKTIDKGSVAVSTQDRTTGEPHFEKCVPSGVRTQVGSQQPTR
jgi:hypothetical protein